MTTTETPRTHAAFGQGKHGVMKLPYQTSCQLERELQKANAEVERLRALMHHTFWVVEDMIKTHTNGCEHCLKKHGEIIARFKGITDK